MNRFQPRGRSRVYALTGLALMLCWLCIIVAAFAGWVMNIFAIFDMWTNPATAELFIRLLGVPVFFIGAMVGWL